MLDSIQKIGRVFYLIPAKAWYGAIGTAALLVTAGIGNSTLNRPDPVSNITAPNKVADVDSINLSPPKSRPMPKYVKEDNLFRMQRKNSKTAPAVVKSASTAAATAEAATIPDVILTGTIIMGDSRIAILDGTVKKYQKVIKKQTINLSGAAYWAEVEKGNHYEVKVVGEEELENLSVREGDKISGHTLEHVYEDHIELTNLSTGETFSVPLEADLQNKRMKKKLSHVSAPPKPIRPPRRTVISGVRVR